MKKGMSKLLSALLIATLVFTSAGVAFAGTDAGEIQGKAETAKTSDSVIPNGAANVQKNLAALKKAAATPKTTVGYINVANYVTGNENAEAATVPATQIDSKYGYSQAYNAPDKGMIMVAAGTDSKGVSYGIFYDAAMSNPVDGTGYASANSPTSRYFKVPAKGTYYIGAYATSSVQAIAMAAGYVSGADRTIKSGQPILVGQKDAQTNYFEFKATQTGYLKIQSSESGDKVTLCNSKKKALSNAISTRYQPTFGVKKGTTYYIKVASTYTTFTQGGYVLQATNSKITEKSGKKKSKAVTIKKKKTKKGTIQAGSAQADWYKFKLGSKKKVTLTMKGKTNNKLKVIVYNQKGKKVGSANTFNYFNSKLTLKSYSKLAKGTYYIKVYRGTKTSSGWYSLYWK